MKNFFFYTAFGRVVFAVSYTALLFASFFLITTPLFNSSDNAFCLYLLGGGFGNAPTELIYYNHLLHPFITIPVKELFLLNPDINWYSVVLILFHFLACSIILDRLLFRKSFQTGIIIYTLFFCVFESHLLLSLSFTSTSLILTISAIVVLLVSGVNKDMGLKNISMSVALLVCASLFRMYTVVPLVGIALPILLFILKKREIIFLGSALFAVLIIIAATNYMHREYYKYKIPNWEKGEQYRQLLYNFYNNENAYQGLDSTWLTEEMLLKDALIIDTNFLSTRKLLSMQNESHRTISQKVSDLQQDGVRWFVINNRIFVGCFVFLIFFCRLNRKYIIATMISSICLMGGIGLLYLFAKIPDYIFLSGLALLSLLIAAIRIEKPQRDLIYYPGLLGILFFMIWGAVRIYKENLKNLHNHLLFQQAATEVAKYPDNLFFVTDYTFPSDYISVFDTPRKYPLSNVVLSWHYSYSFSLQMLKRFGVNDIKELPYSHKILLWGKPVKELTDYFFKTAQIKLEYSLPLPLFKYGEVRKFIIDQ
ncbi:MAG: hypothetical protein JST63_07600 [Bacteroidetes bacterium]|nr:hypothetical protein [Bacteroidota bacterium]